MSKILSREKAQCVPKLTLLIPFKQSNGPSVDLREFLPGICVSFLNDISETRGEKESFRLCSHSFIFSPILLL